jgi:co-chaperonin GroES (HSP10)
MFDRSPDQTMGSRTQQRVDKEMLNEMVLSAHSNMVLIRVPDFNKERVTKSGIILDVNPDTQYFDQGTGSHMADLARVIGIVEKVPPSLLPDGDILPWKTTMDLLVGDTVWFDYMDGLNATSFIIGDDEYLLIPYASCYIAIRDSRFENIICLNGYILFKDVLLPDDGFSPERKIDPLKGKIHAIGNPVEHTLDYWTEDIEVAVGDHVEFRKKFPKVYLERQKYFQQLDKKLFRGQRKDIVFNYGKNL